MSDILSTDWSETDASNSVSPPAGFPEGMQPSGVNNSSRAVMGAVKRMADRLQPIKTTAGTTTAYTLTYDVAAAQYYDGEIHSFVVDQTCGAAATLDINGLGARQIRLFGGTLLAGAMVADQIVQVRYNLADTAFDIVGPQGFVVLSTQTVSGASQIAFPGIPAAVNHIRIIGNVTPATDGVDIGLQTYGADGVLDNAASDYSWNGGVFTNTPAVNADAATGTYIAVAGTVDNSAYGCTFDLSSGGIQRATRTQFGGWARWLNSAGSITNAFFIAGVRNEADRITGCRVAATSGNISGTVTLLASI